MGDKTMKRKFRNMTSAGKFAGLGITLLAWLLAGLVFSVNELGAAVAFLAIAAVKPLANWFEELPAAFEANRNSVTFSILFSRKRIPYSTISRIKIDRELVQTEKYTDYIEKLTIICEKQRYTYKRRLYLDMKKTASDLKMLKKGFEHSKFSKLKRYIERNIYISQ